jgi:hypothetical protein
MNLKSPFIFLANITYFFLKNKKGEYLSAFSSKKEQHQQGLQTFEATPVLPVVF